MASLANATRISARFTAQAARRRAPSRGFKSSIAQCAASNYAMPAMSPTMQEGNITSWKIKEGDSFSAGDVLLEIETDKAQMDVEAQDDGILMKITQPDGSKNVKVGSRIAVVAEPDDDVSSLQIPEDDTAPSQSKPNDAEETSKETAQKEEKSTKSEQPAQKDSQPSRDEPNVTRERSGGSQQYPFFPAVETLLHSNGISESEAQQIEATGPNGRLLKGDVLGYLGRIDKSYPKQQAQRLDKLGHLDLSNIKKAKPPQKKETPAAETVVAEPELPTEVAVPISFEAVYEVQARMQQTLGITLPLSTFIARASEIANENLPRAKTSAPSADELFDAVLGLDKVKRTSRGRYTPNITTLKEPPIPVFGPGVAQKVDLIDILGGTLPKRARQPVVAVPASEDPARAETNVFSVSVEKGEERRARIYLERVKSVLEAEPGRCVL